MAATMHNQNNKHQTLNESDPFVEPAWVKPVKLLSLIMGLMIIAGLVLLVYGLSTGFGNLAEKSVAGHTFIYPQDMTPLSGRAGPEGTILLEFEDIDKARHIILVDPQEKRVISKITLNQGQSLGFAE
jgi:hypothetical protein